MSNYSREKWEAEKQAVSEAVSRYKGKVFGLRSCPGKTFCVSESSSFWGEREQAPLLYTYIKDEDRWLAYAKGTEAELLRQMIDLREDKPVMLTFEEVLERIREERHVDTKRIPESVLRRKVWLAEWHFFGCMSESSGICLTKAEAVDCACSFASDEFGDAPRGMKTDLRKYGSWQGPAYGSSGNVQNTTIQKLTLGELL